MNRTNRHKPIVTESPVDSRQSKHWRGFQIATRDASDTLSTAMNQSTVRERAMCLSTDESGYRRTVDCPGKRRDHVEVEIVVPKLHVAEAIVEWLAPQRAQSPVPSPAAALVAVALGRLSS